MAVRGGQLVVDGAALILAALKPKRTLPLVEWASNNVRLEAGKRYRPWPLQQGILEALGDPDVTQVTVMKSSRIGYSEIVNAYLGWLIDQRPLRVLVYQPTIDDAEDYSNTDLVRLLNWPAIRQVVQYKTRDSRNKIRAKVFPGGSIKVKGANSPKEFRRVTADVVILEEPDGYPPTAGLEGDQAELAFKRCITSDEPKKVAGSSPTVKFDPQTNKGSKIEGLFLAGTQEYRYVPCPHCGEMQRLTLGDGTGPGLRWEPKRAPTKAWYVCLNGCVIEEQHKPDMDAAGEWRASAPEHWPHRSFHVSALYSQFANASWLEVAREKVRCGKNPAKMVTFVNQTLGETWEIRGEAPPWRILYDRREDWPMGSVPMAVRLLLAGIDVQKDRIERYVWGYGEDGQQWLIDHTVVTGDPFNDATWTKLDAIMGDTFTHAAGAEMKPFKVAIDTGFATTQVEKWARKYGRWVVPVKGANTLQAPAFRWGPVNDVSANGKRRKTGMQIGHVGGHILTLELYGFLGQEPPTAQQVADGQGYPPGYVHLPTWATEETCKQLVGDQWMEDRAEWKKVHATEALDCWKYPRAVAVMLGMDRWKPAKWAQLRNALGATEEKPQALPPPPTEQQTHPKPPAPQQAASSLPAPRQPEPKPKKRGWLGGGSRGRGGWI
ncbi:MAG: hypothetical protein VR70_05860 [Rhodospirillaceae bacterium BRH_c57]|nr:MAG: hypothetical protein VR70_05860 [Rhodospirillaceae bacterium BRH_c57]